MQRRGRLLRRRTVQLCLRLPEPPPHPAGAQATPPTPVDSPTVTLLSCTLCRVGPKLNVDQAGLELTAFCLPSAGSKNVCHHTHPSHLSHTCLEPAVVDLRLLCVRLSLVSAGSPAPGIALSKCLWNDLRSKSGLVKGRDCFLRKPLALGS